MFQLDTLNIQLENYAQLQACIKNKKYLKYLEFSQVAKLSFKMENQTKIPSEALLPDPGTLTLSKFHNG